MAFAPADVVPIVLEPLADKHAPRSEYDAKFSLPYSVAPTSCTARSTS